MRSFDLSTNDEFTVESAVLRELQDRADHCQVGLLVVGARARDLLIRGVLGTVPSRATADIDVAVSVNSWEDLAALTRGLSHADGSAHKFVVQGIEVDVIPFHGVETASRTIVWPDDHVMQVLGFEEALATSVTVRLPGVGVQVASLSAQVVLKLVAWQERQLVDDRDAPDLRLIIASYSDGPYLDELFVTHEELLEKHDFDVQLAGADRLGYEALSMLAREGAEQIMNLIAVECSPTGRLPARMGGRVPLNRELLTALLAGMRRNLRGR